MAWMDFRMAPRGRRTENRLVAAGTIYGTNGLWIIPLNDDHTACDCAEVLTPLPISPGDPVDFVGSALIAPKAVVPNSPNTSNSIGSHSNRRGLEHQHFELCFANHERPDNGFQKLGERSPAHTA